MKLYDIDHFFGLTGDTFEAFNVARTFSKVKSDKTFDAVIENFYRGSLSADFAKNGSAPNQPLPNSLDWNSALTRVFIRGLIPAKTESGFAIPLDKAEGVLAPHAWTYAFHPQRGWIPLDAFAATRNPKLADYYLGRIGSDRVAFSVGQNIKLGQHGAPIPVFALPYAEEPPGALPMKLSVNFKKLTWP